MNIKCKLALSGLALTGALLAYQQGVQQGKQAQYDHSQPIITELNKEQSILDDYIDMQHTYIDTLEQNKHTGRALIDFISELLFIEVEYNWKLEDRLQMYEPLPQREQPETPEQSEPIAYIDPKYV